MDSEDIVISIRTQLEDLRHLFRIVVLAQLLGRCTMVRHPRLVHTLR